MFVWVRTLLQGRSLAAKHLRKIGLITAGVVVFAPVITILMIICHEVGHTLVAWAMGDHGAYFIIYERTPQDSCIGCNLYNSKLLSPIANVAVSLGGVLATAFVGLAAALTVGWARRPRWIPRWLLIEIVTITWLGDLVWQWVQALMQLPIPVREPVGLDLGYTDFIAAVSFASQATSWPHWLFVFLGFLISGLWSFFLWRCVIRSCRRPSRCSIGTP